MKGLRERGAALLLAMLTVALVATFAAAALWQQWRAVEIETAERSRVQSAWILTGALDWARLILREDARPNGSLVDHLDEPWAVPLQEARLSSFLAADKGVANADLTPQVMDAFLSGQVIDLQSQLNLANLVDPQGRVMEDQVTSFHHLFSQLGLPETELDRMVENLRFAIASTKVTQPPAQAPLVPRTLAQAAWLGVSPETVEKLRPYVTLLPSATKVNVNTASAEVIAAAAGMDLAGAQSLVQQRTRSPFRTAEAVYALLPAVAGTLGRGEGQGAGLDVKSSFFEVRARLRLDQLVVEERAVLRRDGVDVTVIERERGTPDPAALARLSAAPR